MLLCDHAQVADGKLNIIGGGWTVTGPQPTPFAIAILFQVPWDQANARHAFRLDLLDADGAPVGDPPISVEGHFEVGRPPGSRPGVPLEFPFAMNSGPIALEPGERFEWRLTVDGETAEGWHLGFSTRSA